MTKGLELNRMPISVTLPKVCVDWLDKQVESRVYANRSHAVEVMILNAIKGEAVGELRADKSYSSVREHNAVQR